MTNMKRITVTFPNDIDQAIFALRKEDRFIRSSYSAIIRYLVSLGLKAENKKTISKKA